MNTQYDKDDNIEVDISKGKCRVKKVQIVMPSIIMDNFDFLEAVENFIIENGIDVLNKDDWEINDYKQVKKILELFREIKEGINLIDIGKNKTIPRAALKINKLKKLTEGYI